VAARPSLSPVRAVQPRCVWSRALHIRVAHRGQASDGPPARGLYERALSQPSPPAQGSLETPSRMAISRQPSRSSWAGAPSVGAVARTKRSIAAMIAAVSSGDVEAVGARFVRSRGFTATLLSTAAGSADGRHGHSRRSSQRCSSSGEPPGRSTRSSLVQEDTIAVLERQPHRVLAQLPPISCVLSHQLVFLESQASKDTGGLQCASCGAS